ncbi:MAG: hypothetical protein RJA36_1449 [Pseudomonadota bacterium]
MALVGMQEQPAVYDHPDVKGSADPPQQHDVAGAHVGLVDGDPGPGFGHDLAGDRLGSAVLVELDPQLLGIDQTD